MNITIKMIKEECQDFYFCNRKNKKLNCNGCNNYIPYFDYIEIKVFLLKKLIDKKLI